MKTKITIQKKVAILCCLMMLFFNNKLFSQIVYTDIPDATPNATYSLDLNNDSTIDFIIYYGGSADTIGVMCNPQNNNAYSGNFVNGVHLPWALPASSSICETLTTWYDSNNPGTLALGTSIGNWAGVTDKYLALKLILGTNAFYGWARIDILATSSSFTIKDYAYESTPYTCIQAGQIKIGMNENLNKNKLSISPNPFISSTTIQTIVPLHHANLTLYNSNGQIVNQINNISGQSISISRDELPGGLYYISLTDENKIRVVEKLIITD
jgi:hypothetical protein